jgi:hypothetical protein
MKRFLLLVMVAAGGLCGLISPLYAYDHDPEPRWRPRAEREAGVERDESPEARAERFAERRERMRALREEMLRAQQHPPQPYREDDAHRLAPDHGDRAHPPFPPPSRETESLRRLTPEERRQFRRQIYDAGRDVYRGQ